MNNIFKNKLFKTIYAQMPQFMMKRYGRVKKYRKMLRDTEWLPRNELLQFQLDRLKNIVEYTWNNIEGYRALWEQHGFKPEHLKTLNDIQKIPFITKEILRDNLENFSNKNLKSIVYGTTGGSTGIPFGFYEQKINSAIERAFIYDLWSRKFPEIDLKTKSTVLRGKKFKGIYEWHPIVGLMLSSYEINTENVMLYKEQIEKYKTPIFQAYPSAIFLFCKILKENNIRLNHKFKVIMLGSEPLYDFQRRMVEEVLGSPVMHWYGQSEKVVLAGNCEHDNRFHIYPQYGITEILNKNGEYCKEGESGEIIGTSFWNFATPLIRYKTMDFAEVGDVKCSFCNRNYPLMNKIDGRLQEFIVSKSKNLISMTAVNMHDDIFDDLKQFRFFQDTVGKVVFHYIKKDNTKLDTNKILRKLKEKLNDFDMELQEVDFIQRTGLGKLRFLDQKLDISKYY